jgi:homopolymeric O-antigen transport system ATP-binding protein
MSDVAVRVETLGKRYRIGERAHHKTVRETFGALVRTPFLTLRGYPRPPMFSHWREANTLWALRDVSFELKQGELLGIIGHNGAGKSTLLKILSRITEPTEGYADVRGRVRSLLEIGTGFHPELTGRENIYLNGAILGMKRAEINRKFDEIVAFAEIQRFIDTPVKWYSTGMYTRLAFSVAVHLEPDILIVDEVLAVGDVAFQRKCLAKMEDISRNGRTVFFVSHMMPAISRLCERVLLLHGGRVLADGPTEPVMAEYAHLTTGSAADREWAARDDAPGNEAVRMRSVRVRLADGAVSPTVDSRRPFAVEVDYDVLTPDLPVYPACHFFNTHGTCLFVSTSPKPASPTNAIGRYTSVCWVPGNLLADGVVKVTVAITTPSPSIVHVHERDAVVFEVVDHSVSGALRLVQSPYAGVVRPRLEWTNDRSDDEPRPDSELAGVAGQSASFAKG